MAGRRTNLGLLWGTVISAFTGAGAFMVGTPAGRWVVVAHGVTALVIVILSPWKTTIARRGLARARRGSVTSISLIAVTLATIASGVLLILGSVNRLGPFTTMQVHVTLGVAALALTVAHLAQRPASHHRTDFSRRSLIRSGGVLAAAGGLWLTAEGTLQGFGSRGSRRRFTGSHPIIDASAIPVTQWLDDDVQHLDRDNYAVTILGRDVELSDLESSEEVEATLDCTGGWYTIQSWRGVTLDRVLGDAKGESVVVRSTTGYWRRFPRDQASALWLVTHLAGAPLSDGHGGPVRIVAPGRRGYWWVKWVSSIEVDDVPPWWQPPLPLA